MGPLLKRALDHAAVWHREQKRKYPGIDVPYVSHLAGVAIILARHGFDEDVVAAGALHDCIEDAGVTYEALAGLFRRFSTNKDFEPFDLVDELTARRYLTIEGRMSQRPEPFAQSIDDYVTSLHSQNGFSRERMPSADLSAFDSAVRGAVTPYAQNGLLTVPVVARVVWGSVSVPG